MVEGDFRVIERKKEKEKVETKGAYSHDLHEAIRDVRRAFATGNRSGIELRLNALFDICAPEIREAINQEWLKIDQKYSEQLEFYKNAEYEATRMHDNGWGEKRDGTDVYYIHVDGFDMDIPWEDIAIRAEDYFLSSVWDKIYRERFRACIDCLDQHGELRKWREVDYGKL